MPTRPATVLLMLLVSAAPTAQSPWPVVADPLGTTLSMALSDAVLSNGETLTVSVNVLNGGGGPAADFYFAILLPDGLTVVSAGPGVGARFGRFNDLRTLVPVAQGIGLGAPFTYQNDTFFSYTVNGSEPLGTYRVYFAALTAGALNDGAIGGGELLALSTTEFQIVEGITTFVEAAKTATELIQPAGGDVTTISSSGITYTLTMGQGALVRPTPISVTPIVSASNLPGSGNFVLGVQAAPSGLTFDVPATLTAILPEGAVPSPNGYVAYVTNDEGTDVQILPVLEQDGVLTLTVPHFSNVIVAANVFHFCASPVSVEWKGACTQLVAAYELAGGLTPNFKSLAQIILGDWFADGLRDRIDATTAEPAPPDADALLDAVYEEWFAWAAMYRIAAGPLVIYDGTRPLATQIEHALVGLTSANVQSQERANARCLADKANVARYVTRVFELGVNWMTAFDRELSLYEREYCINLDIDAAPPPVLTPGTPAMAPLSIRAMFTDGVERQGTAALLTITASNALVAPAGGEVSLPLFDPVTMTPSAPAGVLSITGAFTEGGLALIPPARRSFTAGNFGSGLLGTDLLVRDLTGEDRYQDEGASVVKDWVERIRVGPNTGAQIDYRTRSRRFTNSGESSMIVDAIVGTSNLLESSVTLTAESRFRFAIRVPTVYSVSANGFAITEAGSNATPSATFSISGDSGDGEVLVVSRSVRAAARGDSENESVSVEITLQPGTYLIEATSRMSANVGTGNGGSTASVNLSKLREVP